MHLWNDYEGRTIAGNFTLNKLLRSEGRNGFFATSDTTGHSAVIRLTEAHFDEDEQLRRWRQVAEVHQDNLIDIEQVGKADFDGIPLTYALMEPNDANLGDVLKERPLTAAETMQVAKSVLAALSALHAKGLVHEHVEPANVLAVGEVVKLRSDCVRECVADAEFNTPEACAELRRRDVRDFGALLLQCLTLEKEWKPTIALPEPFRRIVPQALEGRWNLDQIGEVLDPAARAQRPAVAVTYPAPAGPAGVSASGVAAAAPGKPLVPPGVRREPLAQPVLPERYPEPVIPVRLRHDAGIAEAPSASGKLLWVLGAAVAVGIVLLLWHFAFAKPAATAPVRTAAAVPAPQVVVAPKAAARVAAPRSAGATPVADHASGWYVIAYTYNHEGQAAEMVKRLRRVHNSLHPQVSSPTGHAPYFVTLGGAMSESEADAELRHARRAGLARDTFVRRY